MISVLVAGPSVVVRAGLESLAREHPSVEVIGVSGLGDDLLQKANALAPDVILAEMNGQNSDVLASLHGFPVVLLSNDAALPLLRNGARAVLPHGASSREIGVALDAAAAGLMVLHPDAMEAGMSDHAPPAVGHGPLTNREVEVLRMLSEGLANKEIAYRLGISEHTVKFHVASVFQKLNASTRTEAVTLGIRQGLIML